MKEFCAVVLGGYVNGYSIIEELSEFNVKNIVLVDYEGKKKSISSRSKYVRECFATANNPEALYNTLHSISALYGYLVIYPTDDYFVEMLCQIYDKIKEFAFVPVTPGKSDVYADKFKQYAICEAEGIPYPKTVLLNSEKDLMKLDTLLWPIIVKPAKRKDLTVKDVFRAKKYLNKDEFNQSVPLINSLIARGIAFIASEFIPGDGSNIYAYTAYYNHGKLLNEWIGRKLSQRPDDFGVFSTATNLAPEIVREQGRILVNAFGANGLIQPEFKYDCRDQKYKLMETNFRSDMWHRIGCLSGVHLNYSLWLDAHGETVVMEKQENMKDIHYSFLYNEKLNLFDYGKPYKKRYINAIRGGDINHIAIFNINDIKPFICFSQGSLTYTYALIAKKKLDRILGKGRK